MLTGSAMETLTRIGFAARGLMYVTIGWLALASGRAEDNQGAIATLAQGGGSPLLVVMALGFIGYGIWRLSEALIDSEGHGADAKGLAVRVGGGVSGIIHFLFALFALRLGMGWSAGDGGGAEAGAETAMRLPGGPLLIGIAALALAGTGLFQLVKAWRADFLDHFAPDIARKAWVQWAGRAGYAARGLTFLVIAWFAGRAATSGRAADVGGLDAALAALPGPLFLVVATGFVLFGVFSFVEARFRRITDPKVLERLKAHRPRVQRA